MISVLQRTQCNVPKWLSSGLQWQRFTRNNAGWLVGIHSKLHKLGFGWLTNERQIAVQRLGCDAFCIWGNSVYACKTKHELKLTFETKMSNILIFLYFFPFYFVCTVLRCNAQRCWNEKFTKPSLQFSYIGRCISWMRCQFGVCIACAIHVDQYRWFLHRQLIVGWQSGTVFNDADLFQFVHRRNEFVSAILELHLHNVRLFSAPRKSFLFCLYRKVVDFKTKDKNSNDNWFFFSLSPQIMKISLSAFILRLCVRLVKWEIRKQLFNIDKNDVNVTFKCRANAIFYVNRPV